ncbi:MAG: Uma2 family endonuclease [Timaviella obliquedivisa GSE-PSE-MK23-08B]|jgi:Uma2 family endonuclease|nr:Uma2 family endonuclease [Timaviella obliquedivisa GSE-PSE-MK23-08B]
MGDLGDGSDSNLDFSDILSVHDYYKMAEAEIFRPDERVEFIAGQVIPIAAKGTAHSAAITRVNRLLKSRLGDRILLRLQDPIELDNYSEPEPDIALVKPDPFDYEDHHPTASEVFLIIEIADSSLRGCLRSLDCYPIRPLNPPEWGTLKEEWCGSPPEWGVGGRV